MSRATLAFDRVIAAVLGLVLIAAGALGVLWWAGRLPGLPSKVQLSSVGWLPTLTEQLWWPWALGAFGVLLVLIGLRWMGGHVPNRGVSHLTLPGSDSDGKLLVEAKPVASAAADAFAQTPGVRSAKGSIQRDRGQLMARINATIEREADLGMIAAASDTVSADLRRALERDDLACQVQLRTARGNRKLARVH